MNYWDHASTTYVYDEVIDTINQCLKYNWGNASNLYSFGIKSAQIIEEAREKIAKAIGALPEEIIFTSGASESNAIALKQKYKCICSPYEHHDITDNPKAIIRDIETLPYFSQANYSHYLYAHMLVNNETGEIFSLNSKIEQAHKRGMWVLVDATQALGNIPIDVHKLNAEFVSFSFHKVHAPKGIGALYIKKDIQQYVDPLIYGTQEMQLRGGTSNVPYIAGAGVAIEKAIGEMEVKNEHATILRNRIIDILVENMIPHQINQGFANVPSILNIAFPKISGEALMIVLDDIGISISTGSACNSGDLKPSAVLSAMGVSEEYIQGAIRISMSLQNTIQDAEFLAASLVKYYHELTT